MPYRDDIPTVTTGPVQNLTEKIEILTAELDRLTNARDNAVARAVNDEQRELARVPLQQEIDKVQAQIVDAESKRQQAIGHEAAYGG